MRLSDLSLKLSQKIGGGVQLIGFYVLIWMNMVIKAR